jgi:hypothetical protein
MIKVTNRLIRIVFYHPHAILRFDDYIIVYINIIVKYTTANHYFQLPTFLVIHSRAASTYSTHLTEPTSKYLEGSELAVIRHGERTVIVS